MVRNGERGTEMGTEGTEGIALRLKPCNVVNDFQNRFTPHFL